MKAFMLRSNITKLKPSSRFKGLAFVAAFVVVGSLLLFATRAAGPFVSLEPEDGAITGTACEKPDPSASNAGMVQFGGCASASGPATPPDVTTNSMTAKSGDKEIRLSWTAVPGATSYRVERIDVSNWAEQQGVYTLPEDQQFKSVAGAGSVSQLTYLDSPDTFSTPEAQGRGLTNGQTYTYRVISNNGVTRGPVKQWPDDGYEMAGWTPINNVNYKKRDARNTGHWGAGLANKDLTILQPNAPNSYVFTTYAFA